MAIPFSLFLFCSSCLECYPSDHPHFTHISFTKHSQPTVTSSLLQRHFLSLELIWYVFMCAQNTTHKHMLQNQDGGPFYYFTHGRHQQAPQSHQTKKKLKRDTCNDAKLIYKQKLIVSWDFLVIFMDSEPPTQSSACRLCSEITIALVNKQMNASI